MFTLRLLLKVTIPARKIHKKGRAFPQTPPLSFGGRRGKSDDACRRRPKDIHDHSPHIGPREAVSQNSTVHVTVDDGPKIGKVKPIGPFKPLLINPFKGFEMILNTLAIGRILWPARTVEGIFGRVFSPLPDTMLDRDWGRFFAVFTLVL
jgi:hypothetical protein